MSEAPGVVGGEALRRLPASFHAQPVRMLNATALIGFSVQATITVATLLIWPGSIKAWPAEFMVMPFSLWLVAFWLILWKPELTLFLVLLPQRLLNMGEHETWRLRYLFALKIGVIALLALALLLRRLMGDRTYARLRTRLDWPMLIYTVWMVVMVAYGFARGSRVVDILTAANELLQIPVIYLILTAVAGSWGRVGTFFAVYAAVNAPLALFHVFSGGRGGGFYSSLMLAPMIGVLLRGGTGLRHRPLVWAYVWLGLLDVLLCQSRTLWVTAGMSIAFLVCQFLRETRVLAVLALLAVLAVGFIALAQPGGQGFDAAFQRVGEDPGRRTVETQLMLGMWYLNGPWLGCFGASTVDPIPWPRDIGWYPVGPWSHNFHITLLFNSGVPGVLLYLWLVIQVLNRGRLVALKVPVRPVALALLIGLQADYLGWVIGSNFSGPAEGHWELGALPALIGVVSALIMREAAQATPPEKPLPKAED